MNTTKLLQRTKERVEKIKNSGGKATYPKVVINAIVRPSSEMTGSEIAESLGLSKTFTCKAIRLSKKDIKARALKDSRPPKVEIVPDLQFLELTDELKSIVKEDFMEAPLAATPSMRFTTGSGIVIEVFS